MTAYIENLTLFAPLARTPFSNLLIASRLFDCFSDCFVKPAYCFFPRTLRENA